MEFLPEIESLFANLGLQPLYEGLRWWVWHTTPHLWFAPYVFLLFVELLIGRKVRASWKEVGFNFAYLTVWITIFAMITPLLRDVVAWVGTFYDGPVIDLTFNANNSMLANVTALFLFYFIFDFFYYWWHRIQHVVPVFWVTHKLHHADQNMGVTTTMKAHPFSLLGRTVIVAIPMALFFKLEPVTIFWVGYSARLFQHFVHMNINFHFGKFNWLLASPNQHRVHHSILPEHRDKNLASFFPIFDVIFGTYYPPGKVAPPTGVYSGETYTSSLWKAFMQPLTDWWKMGKNWTQKRRLQSQP